MQRLDAITSNEAGIVAAAARVTRAGGTLVFPTDTVYGIGCDPAQPGAIEKIYAAKNRPRDKPLSLHCADVDDIFRFASRDDARIAAFVAAFMPGPVTLIVPRPASIDARVTAGFATLGLRVPDHALCRAVLRATGPLAATSANPSGMPAYTGSGDTELPQADLILQAGPTPVGVESTIVDVTQTIPRLVREGAVPRASIEAVLGVNLA